MKKRSIGTNAVLNGIKTLMGIVFPLITYPYISRVLQVENLGKYNFSYSIIIYFYLIAALGISTYSVREGAKYKESREAMSKFASEVFTLNLLSMFFSYALLFILLVFSSRMQEYSSIILVLSISMVFFTIGCEWIYTIYEEFFYITIRTIIFQVASLVLLFTLVKTQDDVLWYAVTVVVSNSGANIVNMIGLKRHVDIRVRFSRKIFVHLIPVLLLFANTVATRIYVNSDITVLGLLTNDYHVGIYTIASKIYSIAKQVLSAVIIVSVPRLALFWGKNKLDQFINLSNRIFYALLTLVVPMMVGLFCLSREVILVISTEEFISATIPLSVLSIALIFCLFNWFYTSCILIPCKKEKQVLIATTIAAVANIVLNILLIPYLGETAAALTTVIAEACSLFICLGSSRKIIRIDRKWKDVASTLIGCVFVFFVCYIVKIQIAQPLVCIVVAIIISIIGYYVILLLLRNQTVLFINDEVKKRLKRVPKSRE